LSESEDVSHKLAELAVLSAKCSESCLALMTEVQRFSASMKVGYLQLITSNPSTIEGNVDFCLTQFRTYMKALDSSTAVFTQIVDQLPKKE
jgi:hypothetical protein